MIVTTLSLTAALVYFLYAHVRMKNTITHLQLDNSAKQEVISTFQQAYIICAKRAIQHRVTLMQIDTPQLRSSHRLAQSMDDLKQRFEREELDPVSYYNKVNTTLDLVSTKNYN